MSKYDTLWEYIKTNAPSELTFEEVREILSVMENGEHWFHTDEQMQFLDDWIRKY